MAGSGLGLIVLVLLVAAVAVSFYFAGGVPSIYTPSITYASSVSGPINLTNGQTSQLITLTITKTDSMNIPTSFIINFSVVPSLPSSPTVESDLGLVLNGCQIGPLVHYGSSANCKFLILAHAPVTLSDKYLINATLYYNGSVVKNVPRNPISFNVTVTR